MPDGSPDARLELLLSQSAWLRRLAYALTRDEDGADELAQRTWLAALEHPPRESGDEQRLRGWLRAVAHNLLHRDQRGTARRLARERAVARAESLEPDEGASEGVEDRLLLQGKLADAVLGLPEPYRTAVTLRYFDGLSHVALAQRLSIEEPAARQRVSRGLAMLRARLDREHPGGRDAWCALCVAMLERSPSPLAAAAMTGVVIIGIKAKWAAALLAVALVSLVGWIALRGNPYGPDGASQLDSAEHSTLVADGVDPHATPTGEQGQREAQLVPADVQTSARVFDREHDLFGIVLDPDGNALPGADVSVLKNRSTSLRDPGLAYVAQRIASTTTDGSGEFSLRLPQGTPFDLEVSHTLFAKAYLGFRYAGERVEVRMQHGACLMGRVVRESDGTPLPGTKLCARTLNFGFVSTGPHVHIADATTDAQGRFVLESLPALQFSLEVIPPCDAARSSVAFDLREGLTIERDIILGVGATIHGRVIDATTGVGLAGAEVSESYGLERVVRTDQHGNYVFCGFGKNYSALRVYAPGYGKQIADVSDGAVPPRVLRDRVDFALTPARKVRGRIIDAAGTPIADVYVAVSGEDIHRPNRGYAWQSARSGADGKFEIDGVCRNMQIGLVLDKPGYGRSIYELDPVKDESEVEEVGDVILGTGVLLLGDLVDEQARPVPNWPIEIKGWNTDRSRHVPGTDGLHAPLSNKPDEWITLADGTLYNRRPTLPLFIDSLSRAVGERTARTDDLGRFSVADLAPGTYTIRAKEPGRDYSTWPRVDIAVAAGGTPERVRLVRSSGLSIAGRVLDFEGRAVARAWLAAQPEPAPEFSQFTVVWIRSDEAGRFRFEGLASEAYRLDVDADVPDKNAVDTRILAPRILRGIQAGRENLEVRLPRAGYIVGRVVDASGSPRRGEWVTAVDGQGQRAAGSSSKADGSFRLFVASDETYDLVLGWQAPDGSATSDTAAIPRAEETLRLPNVTAGGPEIELRLLPR